MHLFCVQILCIDYTSISYIYNCSINQWCIISTVSCPDLYAYRAPVAREIHANALSNCEKKLINPAYVSCARYSVSDVKPRL